MTFVGDCRAGASFLGAWFLTATQVGATALAGQTVTICREVPLLVSTITDVTLNSPSAWNSSVLPLFTLLTLHESFIRVPIWVGVGNSTRI